VGFPHGKLVFSPTGILFLKSEPMAARELEPLGDKSLPAEEQARRKRVLIKGPKEFRELRSRQVKTK
jgi:hypothetical protein